MPNAGSRLCSEVGNSSLNSFLITTRKSAELFPTNKGDISRKVFNVEALHDNVTLRSLSLQEGGLVLLLSSFVFESGIRQDCSSIVPLLTYLTEMRKFVKGALYPLSARD